jgi:hypothetical protein
MPDVLAAPAEAAELANTAACELINTVQNLYADVAAGNYDVALGRLKLDRQLQAVARAIKVARNGELDVRALVLAQVPEDYSWVNTAILESRLRAFDPRLGDPDGGHHPGLSPNVTSVAIMLRTLCSEGMLKRHAANHSVRRRKPGERD